LASLASAQQLFKASQKQTILGLVSAGTVAIASPVIFVEREAIQLQHTCQGEFSEQSAAR